MAPLPNSSMISLNATQLGLPENTSQSLIENFKMKRLYGMQYGGLANFSQTDLMKKDPITGFFPKHCLAYNSEKPLTVIAYAGTKKYIDPMIGDLKKLCKIFNTIIGI
jgi:hypothetical protein